LSLGERIDAAAAVGYGGIGLGHADLMDKLAHIGLEPFCTHLTKNGLKHLELEMLFDWFADGERRRASDRVRDDLLRVAAAAGARHVKVCGDRDRTAGWPRRQMVSSFRELCDAAVAANTKIAIEIQPWSNIYDIDTALEVVGEADHPAGGLCIDIWHIAREGIPYDDLRRIPLKYVIAAEINDALAKCQGTLWEDTYRHRKLCGEGELDVARFITTIEEMGFRGTYSVEIISDQHRALPLNEQARRSFSTARAVLSSVVG
jgi:sugar phosphate isomerase/epimerase